MTRFDIDDDNRRALRSYCRETRKTSDEVIAMALRQYLTTQRADG